MRRDGDDLRLSASDLMRFMACRHATRLDLDCLNGIGPEPAEDTEDAALLQRHGDAHEARHLARLEAAGRCVVGSRRTACLSWTGRGDPSRRWSAGTDVVFQGAFAGGSWGGWCDFLERVERALGARRLVTTRSPTPS